ncbi:MAG: HNH endonuclease [Armatimonadota bacterium]
MIKLERPAIPSILHENGDTWTRALLDAVAHYRGYANIPQNEKDKLIVHYRHHQIKDALSQSSSQKCCFCGSKPADGGNFLEVEHYEPKSVYPDRTFAWDNLLPSCRICNLAKSDHDTRMEPIVDPYRQDPEDYFTYDLILLTVLSRAPDLDIAKRTIIICDLNRHELFAKRADLLKEFIRTEQEIARHLREYDESSGTQRRRNAGRIHGCLTLLGSLAAETAQHSGYMRYLLGNRPTIARARAVVDEALAPLP